MTKDEAERRLKRYGWRRELPGPTMAREIARATGVPIKARDGRMYPPRPKPMPMAKVEAEAMLKSYEALGKFPGPARARLIAIALDKPIMASNGRTYPPKTTAQLKAEARAEQEQKYRVARCSTPFKILRRLR